MTNLISLNLGNDSKHLLAPFKEKYPNARWGELFGPLGARITFDPIKAKQTDSQRGYYWASLRAWGEEQGYSAKESETTLHNAVCCEAFGVRETKHLGSRVVELPRMRSSKLNIGEYNKLIETMLRLAAEQNVHLPPNRGQSNAK